MLRLATYRPLPVEAEPGEIFEDRLLEGGAAAPGIDILDPQQEPSAGRRRGVPAGQRGMGVAEMQEAGRAGGEAGDEHHDDGAGEAEHAGARTSAACGGDDLQVRMQSREIKGKRLRAALDHLAAADPDL